MVTVQRNEKLRIPDFHNEWVEITAFEQRRGGHQWPDAATFKTLDWMKTAVVYLRREDWPLFKRAGFDLRGRVGEVNPPIEVLILNDYVAAVRGVDGKEYEAESREPALHVVSAAAPAINPDNGDVPAVPLAFVEPEPYEPRRRDDGGTPPTNGLASLYRKKALVMASVNSIEKRGKGREASGREYGYVTDEDLYRAVRIAMANAGLALRVNILDETRDDQSKLTTVKIAFTLQCADTGATETDNWTGKTFNTADKAISVAVTNAEKYYLKATFLLSTGDPTDDTEHPENNGTGEPARSSGVSKRQNPPKSGAKPDAAKSAPNAGTAGGGNAGTSSAINGWQFSDQSVTDLMFESKDWGFAGPERMNTINAMRREGAFAECKTLQSAIDLFKARITSPEHGKGKKKTALDMPPDDEPEQEGA